MPERYEKVLRPVMRGLFNPASRHPADPRAVFILALSVFSGLTAFAVDAAPESLESVMPYWSVVVWGALLTAGSVVTLWGMARQDLTGVLLEQVGSATVGATTLFYSGVALWVLNTQALQPVGIILAWGLACLARWIQLQLLIHKAYRIKKEDGL